MKSKIDRSFAPDTESFSAAFSLFVRYSYSTLMRLFHAFFSLRYRPASQASSEIVPRSAVSGPVITANRVLVGSAPRQTGNAVIFSKKV
jgi:hypothetical protein